MKTQMSFTAVLGLSLTLSASDPARAFPPDADPVPLQQWGAAPYWSPPPASISRGAKESGRAVETSTLPTSPMSYVAITPCRLVDTRAQSTITGEWGPPSLTAESSSYPISLDRPFTGVGAPHCLVPSTAQALSVLITALNYPADGRFTVYPADAATRPTVSTVNYRTAVGIANIGTVLPLSSLGQFRTFTNQNADLVVDVNGYYLPNAPSPPVYRWAAFNTYDQNYNWMLANNGIFFGGVSPALWTDGLAIASLMSADKEVLRTLFVNKGYPGANATVWAETFTNYSSTNGRIVAALFRVRNTTANAINWTVRFYYSCYGDWGEQASAALNGVSVFTSGASAAVGAGTATYVDLVLSIPASRTSTAIFVSTSDAPSGTRSALMAFGNNCLTLPTGLQFVDDLDTATGGFDQ